MPIQNYQNFRRLTNLCKSNISVEILKSLNEIQFDDEKVKEFGIQLVTQLVKDISQKCPDIKCYHFFTLNLERSIKKILSNLNWGNNPITGWNPMTTQLEAWDDFPNGRFGDSRSPAFGEIDGYGTNLKLTPFEAIQHWGYPVDISDVTRLFVQFLEDKIPALPWTDRSDIRAESKLLINELIELNRFGLWTISSQPPLNGIPSDHTELGWGPKGGFLYQKSFIEFFCTSEFLINLQSSILKTTSQDLTYLAVNNKKEFKTNLTKSKAGEYDINTVTWGVFTSREIIQPTQIDKESFLAFSEEAFQLWNDWSLLYPPKSKTNQFLNSIGDEVWLVNIVQNDYFKSFGEFVEFLVNCGNH
jgi:methylenetetrahydrofolate reductase (NADPH)